MADHEHGVVAAFFPDLTYCQLQRRRIQLDAVSRDHLGLELSDNSPSYQSQKELAGDPERRSGGACWIPFFFFFSPIQLPVHVPIAIRCNVGADRARQQ